MLTNLGWIEIQYSGYSNIAIIPASNSIPHTQHKRTCLGIPYFTFCAVVMRWTKSTQFTWPHIPHDDGVWRLFFHISNIPNVQCWVAELVSGHYSCAPDQLDAVGNGQRRGVLLQIVFDKYICVYTCMLHAILEINGLLVIAIEYGTASSDYCGTDY